jgi:hypothetical protein
MITPKEAAEFAIDGKEYALIKEFLSEASARQLHEFIHTIPVRDGERHFLLARAALDFRLAEAADITTKSLVEETKALLGETKTLRQLTEGLLAFTFLLLIFTIWLAVRH